MKFVRCHQLKKPGLGDLHLHQRYWSRKVCEALYYPEGRDVCYLIPLHRLMEFFDVETHEQAMAIIRQPT